jgi:hypothetical protein
MVRGAMANRFRRPPGDADVAVTALEKRLSELEQLAIAQSRELRIQFERIAQLQAEWDIMRIRSSNTGGGVDCQCSCRANTTRLASARRCG